MRSDVRQSTQIAFNDLKVDNHKHVTENEHPSNSGRLPSIGWQITGRLPKKTLHQKWLLAASLRSLLDRGVHLLVLGLIYSTRGLWK